MNKHIYKVEYDRDEDGVNERTLGNIYLHEETGAQITVSSIMEYWKNYTYYVTIYYSDGSEETTFNVSRVLREVIQVV